MRYTQHYEAAESETVPVTCQSCGEVVAWGTATEIYGHADYVHGMGLYHAYQYGWNYMRCICGGRAVPPERQRKRRVPEEMSI